jgi:hypothetical protein
MADEFSFKVKGPSESDGKIELPPISPEEAPQEDSAESEESAEAFAERQRMGKGRSLVGGAITSGAGALMGVGAGMGGALGRNAKVMQQSIDKLATALVGTPDTAEKILAARSGLPPPTGPAAVDPAGGKGTYNWAKAFGAEDLEAAKARNMSEAWRMKKEADVALEKIRGIAPEFKGVPERGGLMLPEYSGAGARGVQRAAVPQPKPPQQSPLTSVGQFMQKHPIMAKAGAGALAGFGAGYGGMEASRKYEEGDIPGFVLSSLGAIGALGSIFPLTSPVAAPLAIAAPMAGSLLEGARMERQRNIPAKRRFEAMPAPTPEEIAEVESMGPAMSRRELGYRP